MALTTCVVCRIKKVKTNSNTKNQCNNVCENCCNDCLTCPISAMKNETSAASDPITTTKRISVYI